MYPYQCRQCKGYSKVTLSVTKIRLRCLKLVFHCSDLCDSKRPQNFVNISLVALIPIFALIHANKFASWKTSFNILTYCHNVIV